MTEWREKRRTERGYVLGRGWIGEDGRRSGRFGS